MKMKSFFRLATLAAAALVFVAFDEAAQADEGMWTFDNFPSKTVGVKYGFAPSPDWLNHVLAIRCARWRMLGVVYFL